MTDAQYQMMRDVGPARRGAELFAPNPSVRNALSRRGWATVRFVGQRWWRLAWTATGREAVRLYEVEHRMDRAGLALVAVVPPVDSPTDPVEAAAC